MRRLAIETATEACSVALFENGALIGAVHELVGRGHAERLIPMIAELPGQGRADEILVDCGPGSFTGVRVGLAAARAFAFAWNVPARGYSSLSLIAAAAFAQEAKAQRLAVAIIGGHGEYFVQLFQSLPVRPITQLASLKPAEAALLCGSDTIAGSGAKAVQEAGATGMTLAIDLDARATGLLTAELSSLGPSPIYGRAPDARPAG